jgi:hypothetical protein
MISSVLNDVRVQSYLVYKIDLLVCMCFVWSDLAHVWDSILNNNVDIAHTSANYSGWNFFFCNPLRKL